MDDFSSVSYSFTVYICVCQINLVKRWGGGGGGQDQWARHKPLTLYTYPTSSSTSLALLETSTITFMTLLQGICVHKLQLSINSVRVYSNTAGCDKSRPYVPKVCQYYGLILLFFQQRTIYHL